MATMTKRAMEASLKKLLLEKPLEKITIKDITDDCGMSRMTFYYHFQDIYDLVEWACAEDAKRFLEGKRSLTTWQEGYLAVLEEIKNDAPFILNVYRSVSHDKLEAYLHKVCYELLYAVVCEEAEGTSASEEDKIFVANLYKYAFVGLLIDWVQTGMREEERVIVDKLSAVMEGRFGQALEALTQKN